MSLCLVMSRLDANTGQLAAASDAAAVTEYFFTDKLPTGTASPSNPGNTGTEPLF